MVAYLVRLIKLQGSFVRASDATLRALCRTANFRISRLPHPAGAADPTGKQALERDYIYFARRIMA